MMGGDQESYSASSLTITITNVKIKPPDQGAILQDTNTSWPPEGTKNSTDMITLGPGTVTNEQEVPLANGGMPANDSASSTVPVAAWDTNTQTTPSQPANMQINPNHMNFLLNLPCTLTDQSLILDDVIMVTFFLQIHVRHAERLGNLNT